MIFLQWYFMMISNLECIQEIWIWLPNVENPYLVYFLISWVVRYVVSYASKKVYQKDVRLKKIDKCLQIIITILNSIINIIGKTYMTISRVVYLRRKWASRRK